MSIAEGRTAITAALNEVDGITAYPYRPATLVPGTAWPRWDGYANAGDAGRPAYWLSRWSVFIVLDGASLAASEQGLATWVDTYVDAVVDDLTPAGYVDGIEPARLEVEGGAGVPGIRITLTRE